MVLKEGIIPEVSTRGCIFSSVALHLPGSQEQKCFHSFFPFSFSFLPLRRTKHLLLELLKQFSSKNQWRSHGGGSNNAAFGTAACTGLEQSPCGSCFLVISVIPEGDLCIKLCPLLPSLLVLRAGQEVQEVLNTEGNHSL